MEPWYIRILTANAWENSQSALGSHQQRETGHLTLQAWELGEVGAAHTKEKDQTWEPCEKEVMDRCDGRGFLSPQQK